jgi:hypothetical protein
MACGTSGLVALLRRVTGVHLGGEYNHSEEEGGTMNHMTADQFGRIPEGTKWCPHCSGYGSSLKEASGRCTRCGDTAVVWADHKTPLESRDGEPSERR